MNKLAIVFALVVCVSGCESEPRMDSSTEEKALASIKKMSAKMSETEKEAFIKDCMMIEIMIALTKEQPPGAKTTSLKNIHGMTVAEIRAKAKEISPPK